MTIQGVHRALFTTFLINSQPSWDTSTWFNARTSRLSKLQDVTCIQLTLLLHRNIPGYADSLFLSQQNYTWLFMLSYFVFITHSTFSLFRFDFLLKKITVKNKTSGAFSKLASPTVGALLDIFLLEKTKDLTIPTTLN